MRTRLAALVVVALVAGCGGDDGEESDGGTTAAPGAVATDVCLGEQGFALRPAADGVSAVTPGGVEFTVSFFATAAEAEAAASGSDGSTAVANAVVTPSGKRLSRADLEIVEGCIRGEAG
ncbi:MAG TPA: hypothetical protein VF044_01370 [Actinomycetota bacterium]